MTNTLQQSVETAHSRWNQLASSESPIFFVGSATCGRAAGANDTVARLRKELDTLGIEGEVIETGCLGPPCVTINEEVHGNLTEKKMRKLMTQRSKKNDN